MDRCVQKGKVTNITFRKYENTLMNIKNIFHMIRLKHLPEQNINNG